MANERVNKLLNTTLAGKLTKRLAAKQKNQTEVIKAEVWNEFLKHVKIDKENGTGTGTSINNEITLENAMNSITKYAIVEAKKQNKTANQVAKEWYNAMGLELQAKKNEETNVPVKPAQKESPVEETPAPGVTEAKASAKEAPADEFFDCILERLKNEYDPESKVLLRTVYYEAKKDVITAIDEYSPETGKIDKTTVYRDDGTIEFVNDHDEDGKWIRQTHYRQDGTIEKVNEYNPDNTGEIVFTTHYKEDGKTVDYID